MKKDRKKTGKKEKKDKKDKKEKKEKRERDNAKKEKDKKADRPTWRSTARQIAKRDRKLLQGQAEDESLPASINGYVLSPDDALKAVASPVYCEEEVEPELASWQQHVDADRKPAADGGTEIEMRHVNPLCKHAAGGAVPTDAVPTGGAVLDVDRKDKATTGKAGWGRVKQWHHAEPYLPGESPADRDMARARELLAVSLRCSDLPTVIKAGGISTIQRPRSPVRRLPHH